MPVQLSKDESEDFIQNQTVGRLGCTDGQMVYVIPMNYRYDNRSLFCYSLMGQKINIMRQHPQVCFEIDDIIDSYNWTSVVINGTFEEITDEAELATLRPHYTEYIMRKRVSVNAASEGDGNENPVELSQAAQIFYKIHVHEISGRSQQGAFS